MTAFVTNIDWGRTNAMEIKTCQCHTVSDSESVCDFVTTGDRGDCFNFQCSPSPVNTLESSRLDYGYTHDVFLARTSATIARLVRDWKNMPRERNIGIWWNGECQNGWMESRTVAVLRSTINSMIVPWRGRKKHTFPWYAAPPICLWLLFCSNRPSRGKITFFFAVFLCDQLHAPAGKWWQPHQDGSLSAVIFATEFIIPFITMKYL